MRHLLVVIVFLSGCTTANNFAPRRLRSKALAASCENVEAYRDTAMTYSASELEHAILASWVPYASVPPEHRPTMTALAQEYMALCGEDAIVELTVDLVRFPTVATRQSPTLGPAFIAMGRFLEDWSANAALDIELDPSQPTWEISLGQGERHVAFIGSLDVSAAGDVADSRTTPKQFAYPPFEGTIVGDRLYGSGTETNKSAMAAALVALRTLKQFGLESAHRRLVAVAGVAGPAGKEEFDHRMRARTPAAHTIPVTLETFVSPQVAESEFRDEFAEVGALHKMGQNLLQAALTL